MDCITTLTVLQFYVFISAQMLQERFREFARDTGNIGQERVDTVNRLADELINSGHGDAATVAEWKDGLNEAWADLLELIDTRTQILAASFELHKFYHDAKEILGRIVDKQKKLPEEDGRDQNTVETLQRMHTTFEHDIQALGTQVSFWNKCECGMRGTFGLSCDGVCRCDSCRRTRSAFSQHMLETKQMTFSAERARCWKPGGVCWRPVTSAGSAFSTLVTSSGSSAWLGTSCCGWRM